MLPRALVDLVTLRGLAVCYMRFEGRLVDLRNRLVNFMIRDVYVPDPQKVLTQLYGDQILQGKVIDTSDRGAQTEAFVVVQLQELDEPVVVPVDRIIGVV